VRGEVYGAEYLGTTQIVTFATGLGTIRARLPSAVPVRAGERVGLSFRSEKLSLFQAADGRALRTALHEAPVAGGRAHG
jgi:multiple sugar transport system ATP-binding protein